MRLEFFTPLKKKALFHSLNFTAVLCTAKLLSFPLAALCAAQHGLLHFRFASYAYAHYSSIWPKQSMNAAMEIQVRSQTRFTKFLLLILG